MGEAGRKGTRQKTRAQEVLQAFWRAAGQVLYGMTTFDWVRDLRRDRGEVERLFLLITFGDLVGLPILPPYYTLRLLPYTLPAFHRWRHSILRERDLTDLVSLIEGVD